MALPQAPDIPMPRLNDKEYMDLWRKFLQKSHDNYDLELERDTWRHAFYAVAVILFAVTVALAVLAGVKFMELDF